MFKVYSPNGQLFEVSSEKAKDLFDMGWTPWPPNSPLTVDTVFPNTPDTKKQKLQKAPVKENDDTSEYPD